LYDLELPVEFLTLSGCATGLNAVTAGDELLGLARGLLYAGAQSLLLTLWDVDDASTATLMTFYYDLITRGFGKARALREAMLKVRGTNAHPYYWAPIYLGWSTFLIRLLSPLSAIEKILSRWVYFS